MPDVPKHVESGSAVQPEKLKLDVEYAAVYGAAKAAEVLLTQPFSVVRNVMHMHGHDLGSAANHVDKSGRWFNGFLGVALRSGGRFAVNGVVLETLGHNWKGIAANAVVAGALTPLDWYIIQRQLGHSVTKVGKGIIKDTGFDGLFSQVYRGSGFNTMRCCWGQGLVVYAQQGAEYLAGQLFYQGAEIPLHAKFGSAVAAGVFLTPCLNPLSRALTISQSKPDSKGPWTELVKIGRGGLKETFRGSSMGMVMNVVGQGGYAGAKTFCAYLKERDKNPGSNPPARD